MRSTRAAARSCRTDDPKVNRSWMRYMCCGPSNVAPAVWKGRVYEATIDGRLIAWTRPTTARMVGQTTDPAKALFPITGAPRIVRDKVIIGDAGAEFRRARLRHRVRRRHRQAGVALLDLPGIRLRGPRATPWQWPRRPGTATPTSGPAAVGTAYEFVPRSIYEPNLLYIGTGNGSPWSRDLRSPGGGDNLFLCSIVAVNPDTGKYVWHYQMVPGENWDYTCVHQMTLTELTVDGVRHKVLLQAPKNGFFYVLDRTNGKLLSATNFVATNWASRIDLATGRPVENPDNLYDDKNGKVVIPAHFGAHNWQPMCAARLTRLVYFPAQDTNWVYSHASTYIHGIELEPGQVPPRRARRDRTTSLSGAIRLASDR